MIFAKEAGQSHLAGAEVPAAGRGGGDAAGFPPFFRELGRAPCVRDPACPRLRG